MYIVHVGCSGFPHDAATTQRMRFTFKALVFSKMRILILNKFSLHEKINRQKVNRYDDLPYINLSYNTGRSNSFIPRNLNKLTGIVNEMVFLFKKRKKIEAAIFYDDGFLPLLYYRVLSKIYGFKLVIQYVEYRSAIDIRQKLRYRVNDFLFDNYCSRFCDGIIVISEYLKEVIRKQRKQIPVIKIPVICDFSISRSKTENNDNKRYLLYAGSIQYLEIIYFTLDLFTEVKKSGIYKGNLLLAIGGENFELLDKRINECVYKTDVIYKTNVAHSELLSLYGDADILIIPLRNTTQDQARFPHKVAEYCAAARPILSTNTGELKYYFKDGITAILADDYSVQSYCSKLAQLIVSKEKLKYIGLKGYEIGLKNFDYRQISNSLKSFILKI